MFLTENQLQTLTGTAVIDEQITWLVENGWKFVRNTQGKPVVSKSHCEHQLGGVAKDSRAKVKQREQNIRSLFGSNAEKYDLNRYSNYGNKTPYTTVETFVEIVTKEERKDGE